MNKDEIMEAAKSCLSKPNMERWIPWIHFVASFFYEWTILIMHPQDHVVAAVTKDPVFSDGFERIMGYGLSKLFALLIMIGFWKLFFYVVRNFKAERAIRRFVIIFCIGAIFLFLLWPDIFDHSTDNYVTFSYAILLFPEYWHNAYSSVIYAACLMVLPHPFSICLLQWLLFVFQMGYAWQGLRHAGGVNGKARYLLLLICLIPETFLLISDPYRTEQYALVCMVYVFTILMDILQKREYSFRRNMVMIFFSAFIAVWRTEGILLGALGYLAILIFVNRTQISKRIVLFLLFCVVFLLVSFPQKVGNMKY